MGATVLFGSRRHSPEESLATLSPEQASSLDCSLLHRGPWRTQSSTSFCLGGLELFEVLAPKSCCASGGTGWHGGPVWTGLAHSGAEAEAEAGAGLCLLLQFWISRFLLSMGSLSIFWAFEIRDFPYVPCRARRKYLVGSKRRKRDSFWIIVKGKRTTSIPFVST